MSNFEIAIKKNSLLYKLAVHGGASEYSLGEGDVDSCEFVRDVLWGILRDVCLGIVFALIVLFLVSFVIGMFVSMFVFVLFDFASVERIGWFGTFGISGWTIVAAFTVIRLLFGLVSFAGRWNKKPGPASQLFDSAKNKYCKRIVIK